MHISIKSYLIILASFSLLACSTMNSDVKQDGQTNNLADLWGVEIQRVSLSAADYMLDFRYKVTDVEKATPILNSQIKPYLLIEKNGVKLPVPSTPKLGSIRQHTKAPEVNRIYFMFFKNVSKMVKRGDKVTIVIGDFKAENITVI